MSARLRNLFLVALAFTLLLAAPRLSAQSTGSIRGTIADATGAIVPGAAVTVTNPETGLTRTEQSNESGLFVFPDLPIGSYAVQIVKPGFQTQKRSATELLTGQTIGLEIVLTIGQQTETIEVTSDTEQIKTASSEISQTIDAKQVQDLPINSRNPLQLTTLTPGAALTTVGTESGQQDNVGLTVNGLRPTQNNYQLDGAIYINRFFDSVPILPNPDALREFTIQAANFSAEYAGAGALVQLSTRSGGNTLHGSAFEFFRNTILNSRSYFTRPPTPLNPFKQNQFGGTVGGPILIPHLYNGRDKTFFFFSAEDLQRRSSPNSSTIILPTAAQLAGNFGSTNIHDPNTGIAYPNNQITQPINSVSKGVANAFITPLYTSPSYNSTTGSYVTSPNTNIDSTQYLIKIDHRVTATNQFSARYFYNEDNFQRAFAAPLGFYAANNFRNQSLSLSDTQILSNTLTATFYANAGRFARTQVPVSPGLQTSRPSVPTCPTAPPTSPSSLAFAPTSPGTSTSSPAAPSPRTPPPSSSRVRPSKSSAPTPCPSASRMSAPASTP